MNYPAWQIAGNVWQGMQWVSGSVAVILDINSFFLEQLMWT